VNCCWKRVQNATLATNIGMNEITRSRSTDVTSFERSMMPNRTTAASTVTTATIVARSWARITPVTASTTMRTTTTATVPKYRGYCLRGSGLAGAEDASVRVNLRSRRYWVRPMAMPTAAAPNPQWKPFMPHSQPVSSGPTSPPMLTPM
jgi:hypothetical protein